MISKFYDKMVTDNPPHLKCM